MKKKSYNENVNGHNKRRSEENGFSTYEVMVHMSSRISYDIDNNDDIANAVAHAMIRFSYHDWGDITEEDIEANNSDLKRRVGIALGRYNTPNGYIFIILRFNDPYIGYDREMIMYCDEY